LLKAGGIWVSPSEVEARLLAHDEVGQAVVVAGIDPDGLEKPVAFVVLSPGASATEEDLADSLPRRTALVQATRAGSCSWTPIPPPRRARIRRVELRGSASDVLQK
jgi:acyl-coenzyme A synthetase/AMP-(fatty) acid ligase